MWIQALYRSASPSRFSGAVASLVGGLVWALGAAILGYALAEDDISLFDFFLLMGLMILPVGATLLALGGLVNRRWTARGVQLFAATCLFALSWLFLSVGYGHDAGASAGFGISTVFYILPIGLSGLATLVHGVFAVGELRDEVDGLKGAWLTEALDRRGWVDGEEIAERIGWDLDRAERCADEAGFDATIEGSRLRLDRVAQRHRERIVAMVQARGELPLAELQTELQEPRDALALRVAELRESGDFHGYLKGDVLFSSDLARLRALGRCPACDGALDLAGLGLVTCRHCSTLVYL